MCVCMNFFFSVNLIFQVAFISMPVSHFPPETADDLRLGRRTRTDGCALQEGFPAAEVRTEVHGQRHGPPGRGLQQAHVT